ncbi:hypothetical protein DIPPA_16230 [Diplonema papillatum]|nr:hypothetical protein DIPPA_16230 [Diplonema papillatum]
MCTDPNPSADSLSDWTCTCPFPSTKSALGKAANCPFNECDHTCSTCANTTCTGANQTCTDPNPTSLSVLDWICTCPFPSTAASVASRVASCDFDECTVYTDSCLDLYNQTCKDPDLSVADDWQCHCSLPLEDVVAGRPASCRLDECEVTCDSCENGQCSSGPVVQTCTDPNPSSLSVFDWQCHCPAPSTVVAIKHAASCPFNECTQPCATCANGTCAAAGQTCADMLPSSGSLGDWVCHCAPPSRASNVANAVTQCDFDECETHNRTCGVVNQTCSDPDQLVSDNWVCECQAPLQGNAIAFYADCTIDECVESCASCEEGLCDGYGQDCEDPDTSAKSLSDWVCACKSPSEGRAVRARASCVLDECEVETDCDHCEKGACQAAGQNCRDPNTTAASTSDWTCSCVLPSTGTSVGQPASPCLLDECASDTNEDTCANHGQTCHDPQPYANSTGNWECHCVVPPALNESSAQAAFATCEYPGECETAPLAIQCLDAGNLCYDPDVSPTSLGDWICMCAPPLKGANGSATNSIVCEIDECSEVCATCASTEAQPDNVCVLAGQTCDDPSYRTFHDWSCNVTSLSDWTCTCIDGVGSSTAAKADCVCDECLNTAVCTDKGQLCSDKDKSCPGQSDFECECTPPSVGSAVATFVVQCETDECESHGSSCDIAGQNCVDNDRTQFDDWACECPQPSSGSATGGIATCELNECLALCSHCENDACANATDHQKCNDPNISASSINDWTCTCAEPGVGSATASAAVCACDECDGNTVCSSEGQTCIDNVQSCAASGDFTCECAPPSNGSAAGKPAVCLHDECAQNTVCAAQNQNCSDPEKEMANTWICECVPPFVGTGAQEAAACTVDECEEETCPTCEKGTCSLAGQTCEDPDTSATSLQDWTCTCTEGTGNATAKPATCTCNECIDNVLCLANGQTCVDRNTTCHGDATPDFECRCQDPWEGAKVNGVATCEWDECAVNGTTCTSEGQTCEDTDLTSENTWRCVCPSPSSGRAMLAVASCVLDECETECAHCENDTCSNAGQQCADSNSDEKSKSDWTCMCNPPGIGKATQRAATCVCDECADDAAFGICVSAGQACEDRNKTCHDGSSPDYTCSCADPYTGSAQARAAVCELDECSTVNASVCVWSQQVCNDTDLTTLDTWMCLCPSPAHGFEPLGLANCTLDECVEECDHCENDACTTAGQECTDPNPSWLAEQDWTCTCKPPQMGSATGSPASCACDECSGDDACTRANQTCNDLVTTCHDGEPDYTCYCVHPLQGSAVGEAAQCQMDECDFTWTCTDAKQTCTDPDLFQMDDWYCECPEGTVGSAGISVGKPVAKCELNECTAKCASCANATCTDAKQGCRDANSDMNSLRDWVCTCPSPSTTEASLDVAVCQFDECTRDPCIPKDCPSDALKCSQTCSDHDQALDSSGDFFCVCPYPSTEIVKGKPAGCMLAPCYHTSKTSCVDDEARCVWVLEPGEPHCEKEPCTSEGEDGCLADDRCGWGPVAPPGKYSDGMPGVVLYTKSEGVALFPADLCGGAPSVCAACSAEQTGVFVEISDGFVAGVDRLSCPACTGLGIGVSFDAAAGTLQLSAGNGSVLSQALASVEFATPSDSSAKRSFAWAFGTGAAGAANPCVGAGESSVDAYSSACSVAKCVNDTQAACESDPACRWVGSSAADPCVVEHCAGKQTERDCESDDDCFFDAAASPAACKLKPCSGLLQARDCAAGGCAWDVAGQRCFEKDCGAHGADRCGCESDALCYWDAAAAKCVSERYGICPVMDVVLLLPGTSTMAASFGNHPHGFYALTEMLRDWVGSVPLTGESAAIGLGSVAEKGGIRVALVQFAGAAAGAVALTAPAGTGAGGLLAGDARKLSEDVSWQEDQFLAGSTRVQAGLQRAVAVFAGSPAGRTRVVVVFAGASFADEDADLAPLKAQLSGQLGAHVFGVGIRKAATASAIAAAQAALRGVAGDPAFAASVQIDEIPGLLDSLCDSNTAWGHALNPAAGVGAHGPCPQHPSREACVADPGCLFDGKTATCGDSPCVRHCDKALCSTDPDLACTWDTVAGEVGCWRLAACAHGQNATKCLSDPMCQYDEQLAACAPRPCAYATEEECAASDAAAVCEWDSDSASCRPTPCAHATAEPCQADAACQWNPCNGCAAKRCGAELDTMALCTADLHCQWDSRNSTCSLKPCALYSETERCCKAQDRCVWDVASSPAMCAAHRCSEHDAEPEQCGLTGNGCAYNAQTAECTQLSCQALGQCDCLQEELCGYNARSDFCVGMAYATCPALDVVVLIDGSEAMARAYGRHPVGFVGLVEALKDWVSDLPLAESGDAEHGSDRVRVAFVQFSAGLVTEPPGTALTGSREAARAQLEWHLDNFEGAAGDARVHTALAAALSVFEAAGGDPARKRVLLVLGGSPVADAHDAAAVRDRASLEARGVAIYTVLVANPSSTVQFAGDSAATLRSLSSEPADTHHVSAALPEVPAAVLTGLCDPESAFGASISNETSTFVVCARVSSQKACANLPECDWDDRNVRCVTSHCAAHCGSRACGDDARQDCAWAENACVRVLPEKTCADLTEDGAGACESEAACEWLAAAEACIGKRCDHSTETGCLSHTDGEECAWDSTLGRCAPPPCGYPTPRTCAADAQCGWVAPGADPQPEAGATYAKGQPTRPFAALACTVSAECGGAPACGAAVSAAAVRVAAGYSQGKDVLGCPGCSGLGVAAEWQESAGVLHLSAAGKTAADFAEALRSVEFSSTSDLLALRAISWNFGPGVATGPTDRLYRYHPCAEPLGCTHADALASCAETQLAGKPGYPATILGAAESEAVRLAFAGRAGWIGAQATSGFWTWAGGAGVSDVVFESWADGEPSLTSEAAGYWTAPEGRWVARALGTPGQGYVCEWENPWSTNDACAGQWAGEVSVHAASCQVTSPCGSSAGSKAECEAQPACSWGGGGSETCRPKPCGLYPTEVSCRADDACLWSVDSAPAVCTANPCLDPQTQQQCEAVTGGGVVCAWNETTGVCGKTTCESFDACGCKAHAECWGASSGGGGASCVSAAFALCPAMDVVVAFSGAAGLGQAFGRRPLGYYAVLAMLRDWAAALPLGGVRVAFSQFSGGAVAAASFGTGAAGLLTSGRSDVAAELAWHADHFLSGDKSLVAPALAAAARTLGGQADARKKVVLVVGFGSLDDSADSLAAGVVGLNALAAARLCVVLRRAPVATQRDEADWKTWLPVVSPPAGLSLQASALEELPAVLSSLCNPNAPFGEALGLGLAGAEVPCLLREQPDACDADLACAWAAGGGCVRHACAEICAEANCTTATQQQPQPQQQPQQQQQQCAWDSGIEACAAAPRPAGCAAVFARGGCLALACEWDAGTASCTDALPCAETPAEGECSHKTVCRWTGAGCVDELCEYAEERACSGTPACAWTAGEGCQLLPALCRDRGLPLCEAAGETCKLAGGACVVNPSHAVSCTPLGGGGVCCECKGSWTGAQCDECDLVLTAAGTCEPCTRQQTCSGHGTCSASGVCACDSGWSGADCSVSLCTPRGPAWFTLYPNQPLAGVEFAVVVHGCFPDGVPALRGVMLVDESADCTDFSPASACIVPQGGAAELAEECTGGVLAQNVRAEAAGQELILPASTAAADGTRRLRVCGAAAAGGGWVLLPTHDRTGARALSFKVSATVGKDTGAGAAAAAVRGSCFDGVLLGDVEVSLKVIVIVTVVALLTFVLCGVEVWRTQAKLKRRRLAAALAAAHAKRATIEPKLCVFEAEDMQIDLTRIMSDSSRLFSDTSQLLSPSGLGISLLGDSFRSTDMR